MFIVSIMHTFNLLYRSKLTKKKCHESMYKSFISVGICNYIVLRI